MNTKDIDDFVEYLIREICEGCTECEPRLSNQWSDVICATQGQVKWLQQMRDQYKLAKHGGDTILRDINGNEYVLNLAEIRRNADGN